MRLSDARVWIALLSTVGVAWLSIDATRRTSPGPVTAVHGRIAELEAGQSCSACHGGWFRSMTESCLSCHEPIAAQLEHHRGLHGSLGDERAAACAVCHSEHHGETFAMVNRASFAQAGIPDPERFDHVAIGFEMDGRHLELGCVACHLFAEDLVLPAGAQRFLGLQQDCASCHDDPHQGKMQVACADCHGQQAFDQLDARGHEQHLPLVGGHGDVGCRTCHEPETPHALELAGAARSVRVRACTACHDSPHRDALTDGAAALEGTTADRACGTCHVAEHESFRAEGLTVSAAQHLRTGFALDAPHADVACAKCHDPAVEAFAARHPGRAPDDCRVCHQDPHGGQFDVRAVGEQDCLRCHERSHFDPHAFTAERHAQTALPLTGKHATAECGDCHAVPAGGGPRAFRGTQPACAACHDDAHDGFFAREGSEDAADCARCHGSDAFSNVADRGFDHHRDAGFAIAGAHAQSACEDCHPRAQVEDAHGRSFGRVAEHFGTFTGCATCHRDPHGGRFDAAGLPTSVGGRTDCARCHVETSFRTFEHPFDHGRWTGYELAGAHAKATCTDCHAPRFEPDRSGRTADRARGTRCADCHADPHAGQFVREGRVDCAACHLPSDTFAAGAFDHDRDSRFALGVVHRAVACAACHKPFKHADGETVRYRPLPIDCAACHGTNEDPLRRARRLRR